MEKKDVIIILNKLQNEGYIKILNWDPIEIILRSKTTDLNDNFIESWVDEYRLKFKGKKPGSMGDRNACINKFKELLIRRPNITKEDILRATDKYIQTEANNRYKYLMQADYFISKSTNNTKEGRISKLEAYYDELNNSDTTEIQFNYDI